MTPAKTLSLLVFLCLFASLPLSAQGDAPVIPRYRFEVGQKIVFEGDITSKARYGTTKTKTTWTIWVTDRTSAGGYHLVLKRTTSRSFTPRNSEKRDSTSSSYG